MTGRNLGSPTHWQLRRPDWTAAATAGLHRLLQAETSLRGAAATWYSAGWSCRWARAGPDCGANSLRDRPSPPILPTTRRREIQLHASIIRTIMRRDAHSFAPKIQTKFSTLKYS